MTEVEKAGYLTLSELRQRCVVEGPNSDHLLKERIKLLA